MFLTYNYFNQVMVVEKDYIMWLIILFVKSKLFFAHYDREDIIWSMLRIHTSGSVVPSISVRSLHKVIPQVWINVLFIDVDEVVTVMPHWC